MHLHLKIKWCGINMAVRNCECWRCLFVIPLSLYITTNILLAIYRDHAFYSSKQIRKFNPCLQSMPYTLQVSCAPPSTLDWPAPLASCSPAGWEWSLRRAACAAVPHSGGPARRRRRTWTSGGSLRSALPGVTTWASPLRCSIGLPWALIGSLHLKEC